MKKSYITPIVNTELAEPTSIIAVSINGGDSGIGYGGASDGDAHAPEDNDWNVWGDE